MSEERNSIGTENGLSKVEPPETEVVTRASRRIFSVKYKKRICDLADACSQQGELGALLRREGLHSSTLRRWREQRDEGALGGLTAKKRGPKATENAVLVQELAKKDRRIAQLEKKLMHAELLIDVQKKVSILLGINLDEKNE